MYNKYEEFPAPFYRNRWHVTRGVASSLSDPPFSESSKGVNQRNSFGQEIQTEIVPNCKRCIYFMAFHKNLNHTCKVKNKFGCILCINIQSRRILCGCGIKCTVGNGWNRKGWDIRGACQRWGQCGVRQTGLLPESLQCHSSCKQQKTASIRQSE
jgi:hypothetical protein